MEDRFVHKQMMSGREVICERFKKQGRIHIHVTTTAYAEDASYWHDVETARLNEMLKNPDSL